MTEDLNENMILQVINIYNKEAKVIMYNYIYLFIYFKYFINYKITWWYGRHEKEKKIK